MNGIKNLILKIKEFKEIRTKVMEGNVDAQNPWNTSQIKVARMQTC